VAVPDESSGVRIKVFFTVQADTKPTMIELKRFSSSALPRYMIPDEFIPRESLPKTSTDKVDYQRLLEVT